MDPENIRQARQKAGLTQKEFGKIFGVSQGAIQRWESGRSEPARLQTLALDWFEDYIESLDETDREWRAKELVAKAEEDMEDVLRRLAKVHRKMIG